MALRDEGTSYHYIKASRFIKLNKKAREVIETTLKENNFKVKEVITWTTDGFFRETKDLVNYRISEGCSVVEMECSALASVAEFRKAIFGEILFTGDSLGNIEKYDSRHFKEDSHYTALILSFESIIKL